MAATATSRARRVAAQGEYLLHPFSLVVAPFTSHVLPLSSPHTPRRGGSLEEEGDQG